MAEFNQVVTIDGKKYEFSGNVDFSNLTVKKVGDDIPDPEPPTTDPTKPNEGVIKPGGWGADLVNKAAWKVVNMKNPPEEFKVVDAAGKNVATNFKTKEVAENFIAYFQTHPFPPEDTTTPEPPVEPPTPPKPEPPVEPPTGNKAVTKDGVQLLFSDGKDIVEGFKENFRDDGRRYDNVLKDAIQSEAQGYFRFKKDPVDDEVSIKWSEMSHSGKNNVNCYDTGIEVKTGKARMRFENPHPEYSGNIGSGQGVPLGTKFIGYKGVKLVNKDGTVTIKLYQDTGDNEGAKPANNWKEIYSHTDSKYKRTGAHPYITIRIDDPDKNKLADIEAKWISVARV